MPQRAAEVRVAHTGDVHLEENPYFGDTAQCLEWFVSDAIRAGVDVSIISSIRGAGTVRTGERIARRCFDNRFEVRFRTQRPKADGRGFVDDFDVEVRNKSLDGAFAVDELSGGQFVLVYEALNLGIAKYNARKGEGIRKVKVADLRDDPQQN